MLPLYRLRTVLVTVALASTAPGVERATVALASPGGLQPPPSPTSPAGSLFGDFDVTPSGTARYRIPLAVAHGRGGIEPQLALVYDSGEGDGPVGVGWSLEGLSQIERCASSPAVHGRRRPVRMDAEDALCLDGQPLVLVQGTEGEDGAEYRTDHQSFRRVVGVGTPHSGFRVHLPDGLLATYGITPECTGQDATCTAVARASASVIRTWMLASLNDRFGNWLRIEWLRRQAALDWRADIQPLAASRTAEYLPRAIRYTGNSTAGPLEPRREVEFVYEDRPDGSYGFLAGVPSMRTRRLSKIVSTVVDEGVFREYRLSYAPSRSSGRSLLSSVTACSAGGVCQRPTTFRWNDEARLLSDGDVEVTPILAAPGRSVVTRRSFIGNLFVADVNGDGRSDLVYVREITTAGKVRRTWHLALAYPENGAAPNGGAPALPPCPAVTTGTYRCEIDTGIEAPPDVGAQTLDYDRDGRTDLLVIDTRRNIRLTTWKVLRSTGNGLELVNTYVTDRRFRFDPRFEPNWATWSVSRVHLADVNGDGGTDLITCEPRLLVGPGQPWHVRLHTGSGWGQERLLPFPPDAGRDCRNDVVMIVDANGDGAADLLIGEYETTYSAAIFTGPSVTYEPTGISTIVGFFWQGNGQTFFTQARAADVNGDGLTDVIADRDLPQSMGTLDVWLNTGKGFAAPSAVSGYFGVPDQARSATLGMSQVLDYRGDGRTDLLITTACPPRTPASISGPCSTNPRWQVLEATGDPVQLGDNTSRTVFRRTELGGCPEGGDGSGCLEHRAGPASASTDDQWFGYQQTRVADVDGDLLPDLIMVENDRIVVRRNQGPDGGDRLAEIRDGLAWDDDPTVRVVYKPTTDASVVLSTTQVCALPLTCERPDRYVVASHSTDAGPGQPRVEFAYEYGRPRRDTTGRGWLGFRRFTVTNTTTGAKTTTFLHAATAEERSGGRRRYPRALVPMRRETVVPLGNGRYRSIVADYTVTGRTFDGNRTWYTTLGGVTTTTRDGPDELTGDVLTRTSTSIAYDSWGNPRYTEVDDGSAVRVTEVQYYNSQNEWLIGLPRRTTVTETVGGETQSGVQVRTLDDHTGRVIQVDTGSPAEATAVFGYDAVGNLTSVKETDVKTGEVRTTTSSYDADPERMYPLEVVNPLEQKTTFEVDRRLGVVRSVTDPNGVTTNTEYDDFGRVVRRTRPGYPTVTLSYDLVSNAAGQPRLEWVTSMAGSATVTTTLDRLGRPVRRARSRPSGGPSVVDVEYDAHGRLARRTPPYVGSPPGHARWEYDVLGRPVTYTRADGSVVGWRYSGLTVERTDSLNQSTALTSNSAGQPMEVVDADGNRTRYEYGPFGAVRRVIDADGNVGSVTTDARGRILMLEDPDSGVFKSAYDGFGRLVEQADALGRVVTFRYDALSRVIERKDADGVTTYAFDDGPNAIGALVSATGPSGTFEKYEHDEFGRVTAIRSTVGDEEVGRKIQYDEFGRLRSVEIVPSGEDPLSLYYEYASDGRLLRVKESAEASFIWSAEARNARGQVTAERFRGRTLTLRTIDPRTGRLERITTTVPGPPARVVHSLKYRYDAEGNLLERSDDVAGVSEQFTYDKVGRLSSVTPCESGSCEEPRTIKYDTLGNITSKWDVGEYKYDSRPHAVVAAGDTTYDYDAVGNQIRRAEEIRTFTARNKLARVERPGAAPAVFVYDAFGRLAAMEDGAASHVRIGGAYQRRRVEGGVTETLSIAAAGRVVAVIVRGAGKQRLWFVHPDHLGSPAVLTDPAGQVTGRIAFDVFGRSIAGSWNGPTAAPPDATAGGGFTGHASLDSLGLIDTGGRAYDPGLARFLSPDPFVSSPLNGQSLNRYSYGLNNPLRFVDPSGYEAEEGGDDGEGEPELSDYWDFSDDPAYIHVDNGYDDLDDGDVWGPDDTGSYDTGGADTDDGEPDGDDPGNTGDGEGFDIEWEPWELFDDFTEDRDDAGQFVEDAIDSVMNAAGEVISSIDPDVVKTAAVVTVAAGVAVGVAAATPAIVKGLGAAVAGGAALSPTPPGLPAPVDLPPLPQCTPPSCAPNPSAPSPIDFGDAPPALPNTYQPPSGGLNLAEDFFGQMMDVMPREEGWLDVAIHGTTDGTRFALPDGTPVSPSQLAQIIRSDFNYNGHGIRLMACCVGGPNGAAQALANELGVQVRATDNILTWGGGTYGGVPGMLSNISGVFWSSPHNFEWTTLSPP